MKFRNIMGIMQMLSAMRGNGNLHAEKHFSNKSGLMNFIP